MTFSRKVVGVISFSIGKRVKFLENKTCNQEYNVFIRVDYVLGMSNPRTTAHL